MNDINALNARKHPTREAKIFVKKNQAMYAVCVCASL